MGPGDLFVLPPESPAHRNIVPRLANDGSNWVDYKSCLQSAIRAQGLSGYLEGRLCRPIEAKYLPDGSAILPDGTTPTDEELDQLESKLDDYLQRDAMTCQHICNTIDDALITQTRNEPTAADAWKAICKAYEAKSTRKRLSEIRCDDNDDIESYLSRMLELRSELAQSGSIIDDLDFYMLMLQSLPISTQSIMSTIVTEAATAGTTVSIDELVSRVVKETNRSGTTLCMDTQPQRSPSVNARPKQPKELTRECPVRINRSEEHRHEPTGRKWSQESGVQEEKVQEVDAQVRTVQSSTQ